MSDETPLFRVKQGECKVQGCKQPAKWRLMVQVLNKVQSTTGSRSRAISRNLCEGHAEELYLDLAGKLGKKTY